MTLVVRCTCGAEFPSELNRWVAVHVTSEIYSEVCPGCGTRFEVELRFRPEGTSGWYKRNLPKRRRS